MCFLKKLKSINYFYFSRPSTTTTTTTLQFFFFRKNPSHFPQRSKQLHSKPPTVRGGPFLRHILLPPHPTKTTTTPTDKIGDTKIQRIFVDTVRDAVPRNDNGTKSHPVKGFGRQIARGQNRLVRQRPKDKKKKSKMC